MIEIGRFQIDVEMRTLRRGDEIVSVGSRAFDILATVASAAGRLVSKAELMNAVWPETIVEENNIQVHLSALRKILGPDRDLILTVPGRGYQLLQRQKVQTAADEKQPAAAAQNASTGLLPRSKTPLVGRQIEIAQILDALRQAHVLTLAGPGGIGKTSLAIEVAGQAARDFPEPVCFIELAALTTREAVLNAIAQGSRVPDIDPHELSPSRLAAALTGAHRLLLLDNAEHVADHVAEIVDRLVAENHALRVLVTSREPLRIMAETVFRVDSLDVPRRNSSDAEILQSPAVNLFLQRAHSIQPKTEPDSAQIQLIGEICRRLDGIPLALELAAARVATLGVEGVHRRLDDRLAILGGGYRNALPRHQTLRATFDWSFALLDASTQSLFRRLATFSGVFTFETMCAVVCDRELTIANAIHGVSELVAKSLVNVEFDGPAAKYRLAECTRAYAAEKLQAEGETQRIAAIHARYLASCFETQSNDTLPSGADDPSDLQQALDDARNAFDWALSADGDTQLGVELASNLAGALLDRGMIEACCALASRAVDVIDDLPAGSFDATIEMRVRAALASALPYVHGPVQRSVGLWHVVLALATQASDAQFHARALWGLWNSMLSSGKINESMQYATSLQKFVQSRGTSWQRILADELVAVSLHCLGLHASAREQLEDALVRFEALSEDQQQTGRFSVNPRVFCKGTLARIVWLQGDTDKAMAMVDEAVDLVRAETIEPSLTHVLGAVAVPLALMSGDLLRAQHYLETMQSQAALHRFDIWKDCCECLSGCLALLDGRLEEGLARLEPALDAVLARGFRRLITPSVIACAEALVAVGRTEEASARLHDALEFCQSNGELFFVPEIWRALGNLALAQADDDQHTDLAFTCFAQAIELSRTQGAKMWELRASVAMARLMQSQNRNDEALELLTSIAGHFKPASNAIDIQAFFHLINSLHANGAKVRAKSSAHCEA